MRPMLARLTVILKAAPTWLTLGALAANVIAEELEPVLPSSWATTLTLVAGRVALTLTAIVNIIRRVTPVPEDERGLLPTPAGLAREARQESDHYLASAFRASQGYRR